MRLLATRGAVHAHDAIAVGLVDEVVLAADQRAWLEALAADVAASPRGAIAAVKQALESGDERAAFLRVWPSRQLPERLGS
jgi:enoyl-CoA hydratase/carnithine racemase